MNITERTIGEHSLTDEMNNIIDAVLANENIKGSAYAGSGKSTLLRAIEKYHIGKVGLYICYNKSLEREARKLFSGQNVHIATSHSFALNSFDKETKDGFLRKVGLKHSFDTIKKYAELDDADLYYSKLEMSKNWKVLASIAEQYINTASLKLMDMHLTDSANNLINTLVKNKIIKPTQKQEYFNYLIEHSRKLVNAMLDSNNDCPATHDTYVKSWQLSSPVFEYDYCMLDEAQDGNSVLLSVIYSQKCQKIFVGDKYQSIYQFRGGVNSMDITPYENFELSNSFRFGEQVAELATKVLNHCDESITIHGKGFDTQIYKGSEYNGTNPFLFLSHTNIDLLDKLILCYENKVPAVFASDKAGYSLNKLESMLSLHLNNTPLLPAHKHHKNIQSLLLSDRSLETKTFGEWLEHDIDKALKLKDALIWSLGLPESKAKIFLSTAHMSKGLEFDTVFLSDDFRSIISSFGEGKPLDETDLNLFYVAVTRAKKELVIPDELFSALEENLAFTLKKHKPAKCLLDNLLPPDEPSVSAKQAGRKKSVSLPSKKPSNSVEASEEKSPSSSLVSKLDGKDSTQAEPKPETKPERKPAEAVPSRPSRAASKPSRAASKRNTTKGTPKRKREPSDCIAVEMGTSKVDGTPQFWRPTDTSAYLNPNIAVVGTMGTGKTQTVKSMLTQLIQQRERNTQGESLGVLIFDYKSDYSDDEFISATDAIVLEANNLPINPLALHSRHRLSIINTTKVLVTTISNAFHLGPKQQATLKNCILAAYEQKGISKEDLSTLDKQPPTMRDVFAIYNAQKKVPQDSLTSALSDLYDYEVFESNARKCQNLFDTLENEVVVISLSGCEPSLQNMIIAVLLDQFYTQMHLSGKPEPVGQYRALKKLVLVDEADGFMSANFLSLRKILKEGREFGVGMLLSTQGLDHFQNSDTNYADYMNSWCCHRLTNIKNKDVEQLFNTKTKQELDARLSELRELEKHHSLFINGKKQVEYQESTAFWKIPK